MGQQASQFLDCRFLRKDNSSEIKHQELLKDLTLMQKESDQKRVLSLKQRQKSINETVSRQPSQPSVANHKLIVVHDHLLKYSEQSFPKSMEYQSGGFIEIPEISLSDILESRLNTNQFFPPNDIHGMLGGLLSVMAYLQINNISHHDIYPSSIYYSNSRYKLSNPITAQSSYERTFNHKRFSYLSPELIEALINNVTIEDHTLLFKPDVFSLGMVMLEVCSLKSSSQCYDPETYDIVEVNVKNRLNAIEARYGVSVANLIASMLERDAKKRMSATQVFEVFEKPQQRISTGPTDIPVSILKNTRPPLPPLPPQNMQVSLNPERMTRDYNVIVSPPPSNQSLDRSSLNPVSRPPTFGQPMRRDSLNGPSFDRLLNDTQPNVNLQELDNRIDRILATSRKY